MPLSLRGDVSYPEMVLQGGVFNSIRKPLDNNVGVVVASMRHSRANSRRYSVLAVAKLATSRNRKAVKANRESMSSLRRHQRMCIMCTSHRQ